jgi:hypothetical protein
MSRTDSEAVRDELRRKIRRLESIRWSTGRYSCRALRPLEIELQSVQLWGLIAPNIALYAEIGIGTETDCSNTTAMALTYISYLLVILEVEVYRGSYGDRQGRVPRRFAGRRSSAVSFILMPANCSSSVRVFGSSVRYAQVSVTGYIDDSVYRLIAPIETFGA